MAGLKTGISLSGKYGAASKKTRTKENLKLKSGGAPRGQSSSSAKTGGPRLLSSSSLLHQSQTPKAQTAYSMQENGTSEAHKAKRARLNAAGRSTVYPVQADGSVQAVSAPRMGKTRAAAQPNGVVEQGTRTAGAFGYTLDDVPRYATGEVKPVLNPRGSIIKSAYGGKVDDGGILRYPSGVKMDQKHWAKAQAMLDRAYSPSPTARPDMPDHYYEVYDALAQGKGWNGNGIYADSPYLKTVWGNDKLDTDAYNQLYRRGLLAGDGPLDAYGNAIPDAQSSITEQGSGGDYRNATENRWTPPDYTDNYGRAEAALERSRDARLDAQDAATRATINAISSEKGLVKKQAELAAKQAYINHEQQLTMMPQQAAAMGITGGAAESTVLAAQTNYQNNYALIMTQMNEQLADIQSRISQAVAQGESGRAGILADWEEKLAEQLYKQEQDRAAFDRELYMLETKYAGDAQLAQYKQELDFDYQIKLLSYKNQLAIAKSAAAAAAKASGGSTRSSRASSANSSKKTGPAYGPWPVGELTDDMSLASSKQGQLSLLAQRLRNGEITKKQYQALGAQIVRGY